MTTYRADLTGDHHRLIAHLLPGDSLILTWSAGVKHIDADPDSPWIEAFDTDPIPRICRYGTGVRLAQNTLVRQRPPIAAAAKTVRDGGAAYVTCEMRQDTNRFGQPFGPKALLPSGHVQIEPDVWMWEYGTVDGITVYDATEHADLGDLKKLVADFFTDYTWEEVERRGIYGTSVLVKRYGRYVDTGHWVYRRPDVLPPWFPGEPGSQWRDVDGDVWTHADDGYVYTSRRPSEPASPEVVQRKYGPMTAVGGGS